MLRIVILGSLLSLVLSTTGCTSAAVAVIDEKISQMTEKNCTTVNIMLGEDYCRDKIRHLKQEAVYCYKTLGGVDCYREKNPYKTERSERVRAVTALGSEGARVEEIGAESDAVKTVKWSAVEANSEKLSLD